MSHYTVLFLKLSSSYKARTSGVSQGKGLQIPVGLVVLHFQEMQLQGQTEKQTTGWLLILQFNKILLATGP